ncbi:MAG: chromo domain-containing protein, partial [Rhabdochlamydiaceae bacterium]
FKTPWTGPFRVTLMINNAIIIIKNINNNQQKATHISRLKKVESVKKPNRDERIEKELEKESERKREDEYYEVERVVDDMVDKNGQLYYKVRWKGYPPTVNDWVKARDMNCPELIEEYYKRQGLDKNGRRI